MGILGQERIILLIFYDETLELYRICHNIIPNVYLCYSTVAVLTIILKCENV